MTQEIKQKIEQAAEQYARGIASIPLGQDEVVKSDFRAGAEHVLQKPAEFGLVSGENSKVMQVEHALAEIKLEERIAALQSQLAKYRQALERIGKFDWEKNARFENPHDRMIRYCNKLQEIAKQALKQEEQ